MARKAGLWRPGLVIALLASAATAQGILYSVTGPPGATIGAVVAPVGDLDGDGADDFTVHDYETRHGSRVDMHSGRTGSLIHQFAPPEPEDSFGLSTCGRGDVNADGVTDIIIGAPLAGGGTWAPGMAFIYSGSDFGLIRSHVGDSSLGAYPQFGSVVALVGDLDGDAADDYAITSAPEQLGLPLASRVDVFSGVDGHLLKTISSASWTGLGMSVLGLGDVTGDGVPDLAISESSASSGGFVKNGLVRIYSGASFDAWNAVSVDESFAFLGASMASLGDVDSDGLHDFAASTYDSTAFVSGVLVMSPAGSLVSKAYGDFLVSATVTEVEGIADVDEDGTGDVLVVDRDGNTARILLVASATGERLFVTEPVVEGTFFPDSLAGLGDVNGDGHAEFAVGDRYASQGQGTVWVFTTRPLLANPPVISATSPGVVDFTLSPGVPHASAIYVLLASVTPESSSCAGLELGSPPVHVPFCFDPVMRASLEQMNTAIFQSTFGVLDDLTGQGSAKLDVSGAPLPSAAIGLILHFFFLTKPQGGGWDKAWESEAVAILP